MKLVFAHQGVGGILVSSGASYDVAAYGRIHQTGADVALVATLPGWRIHVPGHPDEVESMACRAQSTGSTVRPLSTTKSTDSTHPAFATGSPAGWKRMLARKEAALPSDVITYRNHPCLYIEGGIVLDSRAWKGGQS